MLAFLPITVMVVALAVPGSPNSAEPKPAPMAEMRGLWVCAWDITTPQAIDVVVEKAIHYGFNALFVQVRFRGDRLYIANRLSRRFPNPEPVSVSLNQPLEQFDPLAYILSKGHAQGLAVHAWVTVYVGANSKTPTPPGHPLQEHPNWAMTTESGIKSDIGGMQWLDPGNPQVNPYLENIFCDLVSGYDVDGLHLDYVRYPGSSFGYSSAAVQAYKSEIGKIPNDDKNGFTAWRRDRITSFLSDMHQKLDEIRPGCILSAAVFGERERVALPDCLQDWGKWLSLGIIDYAITMSYSTKDEDIERQCADYQELNSQRHVYVGLAVLKRKEEKKISPKITDGNGAPQYSTAGEEEQGGYDSAESLINKINIVRAHGLPGLSIFSYGTLSEDNDLRFKALKSGPFANIALLPTLPWKLRFQMFIATLGEGEKQAWTVVAQGGAGKRMAVLRAKTYTYNGFKDTFIVKEGELYRTCVGRLPHREDAETLLRQLQTAYN